MRIRSMTTNFLAAAFLALLINTSVLAQNSGSVFSGRITGLSNRGSDAGAANGLSTAGDFGPALESLSANRACTAMNFAVQLDAPPGISRSRTFSLVINGLVSSLITCTISGTSSVTCNSGSATQIVPASAALSIFETAGSAGPGVGGTAAAFGWECNYVSAATSAVRPLPTAIHPNALSALTVARPAPSDAHPDVPTVVHPDLRSAVAVVSGSTDSAGGDPAEVAECKSTLQSGKVSWGGGANWSPENIEKLCNGTKNARKTITCFQSNVEALGWAAAIDTCR